MTIIRVAPETYQLLMQKVHDWEEYYDLTRRISFNQMIRLELGLDKPDEMQGMSRDVRSAPTGGTHQ